jgi:hypothetical protein
VTCKPEDAGSPAHVVAVNFSRGGMFLRTEKPPNPGQVLDLTIELPGGSRLYATAMVRHVVTTERALREERAPGAGVAFRHASIADLAVLEYVASTTDAKAQAGPRATGGAAEIGRLARGTMQDAEPPVPSPTEYSFHRRKPKPPKP